ncbi:hypothetical protein IWW38_006171, partial [Coemansia aciculifera]
RNDALVAGTMDFATDANCYIPGYPNTVCLGSWTVPADLVPGQVYHFVWFWYFNANPAGQWYSTCFDVQVNSASHVVQTESLPALMAIGNPNISYDWGVTDMVRGLIANTTTLANPNNGLSPGPVQPPPQPPSPSSSSSSSTASSSTQTSTSSSTSSSTTTIARKCIPRPTAA